jgi:hypothetical protein
LKLTGLGNNATIEKDKGFRIVSCADAPSERVRWIRENRPNGSRQRRTHEQKNKKADRPLGCLDARAGTVGDRNRPVGEFRRRKLRDKYEGYDLDTDVGSISREGTYTGYLRDHAGAACPTYSVPVELSAPTAMTGAELCTYEGKDSVLVSQEESSVTYTVDVPEAGWYTLRFVYCSVALARALMPSAAF